ncbi:MAG TPA: hypothetical protein PK033_11570 [Acetivibrio sp.]|nr:hypothetical protein [Acetivibrio sp.]
MSGNIVFASRDKLGLCKDNGLDYFESEYICKYQKNKLEISKKYEWKTKGVNSAFRGDIQYSGLNLEDNTKASINGVDFVQDNENVIYSVSVDDNSGIFIKNLKDRSEPEKHVIHDNKAVFYNIGYNEKTKQLAVAVQNTAWERNIAVMDINDSSYSIITEGDSIDDNPVWGRINPKILYYESAGVGRDNQGNVIGFAPRVINKLDFSTGELTEVASYQGFDCIYPKVDSKDNLYFIKRPYESSQNRKVSILEYLFIPFKIIRAIFKWIELFTIMHTGEPLTSRGSNPAKSKQMDSKDLIINGNIINAEKILKENLARGEKYAGIAPKEWELVRLGEDGRQKTIKKGVLGFDISKNNEIIYSNGKYIIKISEDGKEEVVEKVDFVEKIKA